MSNKLVLSKPVSVHVRDWWSPVMTRRHTSFLIFPLSSLSEIRTELFARSAKNKGTFNINIIQHNHSSLQEYKTFVKMNLLVLPIVGMFLLDHISYGWVWTQHHHPPLPPRTTHPTVSMHRPNPILLWHRVKALSSTPSENSSDGDSNISDNASNNNPNDSTNDISDTTAIDISFDPRLYKVRLSRATGIEYVPLK